MKLCTRHGVHHIAATAFTIAAVAVSGGIALANPAWADEKLITEKYIATEECSKVGAGQFCPADPANYWPTKTQFYASNGSIKVEFTANPNHCSDMIAHVFINGQQWGSNIVHPGQSDGGYEIPIDRAGLQQVAIQAEGVAGGCNTGSVSAWGGMLRIWQLT
jgi:hypothetical protein